MRLLNLSEKGAILEVLLSSDVFISGGLETHIETFLKHTNILFPDLNIHYVSNLLDNFYFHGLDLYANLHNYEADNENLYSNYFKQIEAYESLDNIFNFDIALAHPFISLFSTFSFAQKRNIPIVGILHGKISAYFSNQLFNSFFHKKIKQNALLFCVNKSISRKLNINWLPNPIDEYFWSPENLGDDDYILVVSRLDPDKEFGLKKFFSNLKKEFRQKILVVGDGKKLDNFKHEFPEIRFLGKADSSTIKELMSNASVVVGMGRVVLESLFLKKSTILLNYNGDICLIDNESKFLELEEFNFNGTNLKISEKFDWKLWERIKTANNRIEIKALEKFKASYVVNYFWKKVREYINKPHKTNSIDCSIFYFSMREFSRLEEEILYLRKINKSLEEDLIKLEEEKNQQLIETNKIKGNYKKEIQQLQEKIKNLSQQLALERNDKDKLYESLKYIESSKSWKLVKLYWRLKSKLLNNPLKTRLTNRKFKKQALSLIKKSKKEAWIVNHPLVDWNIPLFQRPHHIAINLAKIGFSYFYTTTNTYDNVDGFEKIDERCYLTNKFDILDKINTSNMKKIYHIHAADHNVDKKFIEERINKGHLILYEYMDELHEDLSGNRVKKIMDRHKWVLKNEKIMVVATAKKLYNEVSKYRSSNFILVTNGVDVDHFRKAKDSNFIPEEIKDLVKSRKPIIGYFGALAKWFDYEIIDFLASRNKDWIFLLLGWDYDGSLRKSSIIKKKNVKILGPIPYQNLPFYAVHFHVATIPFVINEITLSTSPIKLFEYFALQKPVVSTPLPEVKQFPEALIAKDKYEFEKKIKQALTLIQNPSYKEKLLKRAFENSWYEKANQIKELIEKNL